MDNEFFITLTSQVIKGFDDALKGDSPPSPSHISPLKDLFQSPPKIVNYHFNCKLYSEDEVFPLEEMGGECPLLRYKFPLLRVLFPPHVVTFSKRGFLTVVGGGSYVEFREVVKKAVCVIFWRLRCLFEGKVFLVGEWRINNKNATCRGRTGFSLPLLETLLKETYHVYRSPRIGFLYVKGVNGVTFSICSNGKVNILKFKYNEQAIQALLLIAPYLKLAVLNNI
jgi:hypothetical protein